MAESANVTSVAAISRFRGSLARFQGDSIGVLQNLDRQANKLLQWLEGEATTYWRLQVLRCHEQISRARSALDTALMRKTKDYTPSCIEEKENLRLARDRLRQAEEKTVIVRKWTRIVREELDEYRGKMNLLKDCLEGDVSRGLALLDRTVRALERYADVAPPNREPEGGVSTPSSTALDPTPEQAAATIPEPDSGPVSSPVNQAQVPGVTHENG